MSRYAITGVVPGSLAAFLATPRTLATLAADVAGLRIDLTVTDAPTGQVDVRIGDGTTDVTVSLLTGTTHSSTDIFGTTWPAGADLELELVTAPDGFNLTAQVFVEDVAGAQGVSGLVSLSDAKTALGITTTDAARDAWLQRSIDALSRRVREYCQQHLTEATYRDEWFGPGLIHLRANPVVSLTSVTADGSSLNVATEVRFDPESGRLVRAVASDTLEDWHGTRYVEAVYVAGHNPLPADLAELLYIGLEQRYQGYLSGTRGLGSAEGVSRIQFPDGGAVTYAAAAAYGSGVRDAPDFLLGFPLSMLDNWRDVGRSIAPSSSQLWEFYP